MESLEVVGEDREEAATEEEEEGRHCWLRLRFGDEEVR